MECGNSVKREENDSGWFVKNNVKPMQDAVRASKTIMHEERVVPKEFKKTKEKQRKKN